jgi:transposase-like protein
MVRQGRERLSGEVEVDETFVGGVRRGVRGRGAAGKVLVLMAVEVRGSKIGRARLQIIPDATATTLLGAVEDIVERGSEVVTDGLASYGALASLGYNHTISRSNTAHVGVYPLPKANRVASLLKRWLLGTHQGGVKMQHLQSYLDEFIFRFNRRTPASRGKLFYRLVQQAVQRTPQTYRTIKNHSP